MKILIYEQENKISIPEPIYQLLMATMAKDQEHEMGPSSDGNSKSTSEDPYFNYAKLKLEELLNRHRLN